MEATSKDCAERDVANAKTQSRTLADLMRDIQSHPARTRKRVFSARVFPLPPGEGGAKAPGEGGPPHDLQRSKDRGAGFPHPALGAPPSPKGRRPSCAYTGICFWNFRTGV